MGWGRNSDSGVSCTAYVAEADRDSAVTMAEVTRESRVRSLSKKDVLLEAKMFQRGQKRNERNAPDRSRRGRTP